MGRIGNVIVPAAFPVLRLYSHLPSRLVPPLAILRSASFPVPPPRPPHSAPSLPILTLPLPILTAPLPILTRSLRQSLQKWSEAEFKSDPQLSLIPSLYGSLRARLTDEEFSRRVAAEGETPGKEREPPASRDPNTVSSQQEEDDIAKGEWRQGIFLYINCIPFWDAAHFHWDAAPPPPSGFSITASRKKKHS